MYKLALIVMAVVGISVAQAPRSATLLRLDSDLSSATLMGSFDGKWRQADGQVYNPNNASELEGPITIANPNFTLYSALGKAGTGRSGTQAIAPTDVCTWNRNTPFSANLTRPATRPLYALNAPWNPQPRPISAIAPTATHLQAISAEAKRLGVTVTPQLGHIQQALRTDLDSDGRLEVILSANRPNYSVSDGQASGQYASQNGDFGLIMVRKLVSDTELRTFVLESGVFKGRSADQVPLMFQFRVGAILDLDGDGRMEIIAEDWVHEGWGATVWRWQDNKFVAVLDWGCGV